jgi:hypothetical protein
LKQWLDEENKMRNGFGVLRIYSVWKLSGLHLLECKASDGTLANTAEIEEAAMLNDIGDLRIAIARSVLEILNDAAIRIQSQHE